jgi:hypothetical protein
MSMSRGVPVQFFQSIIAAQLAVAGALLFQVRFFDTSNGKSGSQVDPRLRLVLVLLIAATLFVSLEAMREDWFRSRRAGSRGVGGVGASHPASGPPAADAGHRNAESRPTLMDNGSRSDPLFRHRDDRRVDQVTVIRRHRACRTLTRAERIFIVLTHAFLTDPIAIFGPPRLHRHPRFRSH